MCEKCGYLRQRIEKYKRFLATPLDDETRERLRHPLEAHEAELAAMQDGHPEA